MPVKCLRIKADFVFFGSDMDGGEQLLGYLSVLDESIRADRKGIYGKLLNVRCGIYYKKKCRGRYKFTVRPGVVC